MSPNLRLHDGAWLVADVHYAPYRRDFLRFLEKKRADLPSQILLMGDIFDLLFPYAPNSIEPNREMVDLLLDTAASREVVYLEGNHDFGLAPLFGGAMRCVPKERQPLMAEANGVRIALHHGDLYEGRAYEIYTALIRRKGTLRWLNGIDTLTGGALLARLEEYHRRKRPCYEIEGFYEKTKFKMEKLTKSFSFDWWIEGHSHQNRRYRYGNIMYANLPAFVCGATVTQLRYTDAGIELVEIS